MPQPAGRATPCAATSSAASAPRQRATWLRATGTRWSATTPVLLSVGSNTHSRFMVAGSGSRRPANMRALRMAAGWRCSRSQSRSTITRACSRCGTSRRGRPKARSAPATRAASDTGSCWYHCSRGNLRCNPARSRAWLGELLAPASTARPRPPRAASRSRCGPAKSAKSFQVAVTVWLPSRRATARLRSTFHRSSTLACIWAEAPPRLQGCSGLPSTLMGRPS